MHNFAPYLLDGDDLGSLLNGGEELDPAGVAARHVLNEPVSPCLEVLGLTIELGECLTVAAVNTPVPHWIPVSIVLGVHVVDIGMELISLRRWVWSCS